MYRYALHIFRLTNVFSICTSVNWTCSPDGPTLQNRPLRHSVNLQLYDNNTFRKWDLLSSKMEGHNPLWARPNGKVEALHLCQITDIILQRLSYWKQFLEHREIPLTYTTHERNSMSFQIYAISLSVSDVVSFLCFFQKCYWINLDTISTNLEYFVRRTLEQK